MTCGVFAEAKARLLEVIDRAQGELQVITRNGKPSAIVVSVDEWARKTARKGALAEFLLNSPLRGAELDLERQRDEPRDLRALRFHLDTNVLSETRRPEPDRRVLEWLDWLDEDRAFISVVTLADIRRGVARMAHGRRRDALANCLACDLIDRFASQILIIDEKAAYAWGDLMAEAKRLGAALASMDSLRSRLRCSWPDLGHEKSARFPRPRRRTP